MPVIFGENTVPSIRYFIKLIFNIESGLNCTVTKPGFCTDLKWTVVVVSVFGTASCPVVGTA